MAAAPRPRRQHDPTVDYTALTTAIGKLDCTTSQAKVLLWNMIDRIPAAARLAEERLVIRGPPNEIEKLSRWGDRNADLADVWVPDKRPAYEICRNCGRELDVRYNWGGGE